MRINKDFWLLNRPVAHRGLWGGDVVENSLTAYENAVKNGYPIEIDIYQSADGVLFSFHDQALSRMTGADGLIFEKTAAELKSLKLSNTEERIPTLDEVLELVDGKVPLLIEFKDQPDKSYIKNAVDRLKGYNGEFAVQAFNPFYLKKIKKLAPEFIRGILATEFYPNKNAVTNYLLKTTAFNFMTKPDFISYSYTGLPLKKNKKALPVIAWTVTDQKTADRITPFCDNIIFEGFIPERQP